MEHEKRMPCTLEKNEFYTAECGLLELNKTLNFSIEEAYRILLEHKEQTRNINKDTETIFITIYCLLISLGLCSNILLIYVVLRKASLQTPRNLYIANLAFSDMTMCLICMPFTLVMIIKREWTMGSLLCKLVPMLQGSNIMLSIGTITMIALDRYFTIVKKHYSVSTKASVIRCIVFVWAFSMVAVSPLAYFQIVEPITFHKILLYEACIERWPSHKLKVTYTICILVVQTVIPALVVATVHGRIAAYLHTHAHTQTNERIAQRELRRNRRTTFLLLGIAVLFVFSWLPLNLFSFMTDLLYPPESFSSVSTEKLYTTLAICHIIAMSSAISNPILYGWLNTNVRKEFIQMFQSRGGIFSMIMNEDRTTTRTALPTSVQKVNNFQISSVRREDTLTPPIRVDTFVL